jgi:hypothetical protein
LFALLLSRVDRPVAVDRVRSSADATAPDLLADIGDESTVAAGSLVPFLAVSSTTFSTVV